MNNIDNFFSDYSIASSFLSQIVLFSALEKNEFDILIDILKPLCIKKGESIFNEGDAGEEMYVFFSGFLSAFGTQCDGTQRKLFDVKQGDFFGEMSIIAHEPRSATITALEDSVVISLKEADFYNIINKYPSVGFKLLRTISVVQNQWLSNMSRSYNDLIRWGETARRRAITDEMTGLYNRHFLEESIKERFQNQSMNLRIMSLLMMDLDKIHSINDRYGTKGGDTIILACSQVINSCLRPGDIPARLSGDEFAILLPDTDLKNAVGIAERIRENIENLTVEIPGEPESGNNASISTRTSIGVALAPTHARTLEELYENSDAALRKAKELGRNRVEIFNNNK